MPSGYVKTINEERGYGFICELGGPDVYFHYSALKGLDFEEQLIGRRVVFEIENGHRGERAKQVRAAI